MSGLRSMSATPQFNTPDLHRNPPLVSQWPPPARTTPECFNQHYVNSDKNYPNVSMTNQNLSHDFTLHPMYKLIEHNIKDLFADFKLEITNTVKDMVSKKNDVPPTDIYFNQENLHYRQNHQTANFDRSAAQVSRPWRTVAYTGRRPPPQNCQQTSFPRAPQRQQESRQQQARGQANIRHEQPSLPHHQQPAPRAQNHQQPGRGQRFGSRTPRTLYTPWGSPLQVSNPFSPLQNIDSEPFYRVNPPRRQNQNNTNRKIPNKEFRFIEKKGNMFESPPGTSYAHCVDETMKMARGVATQFRKNFGHIPFLKSQLKTPGEVAILPSDNRYIFCLVTKSVHNSYPEYSNILLALKNLRKSCEILKIKNLAIPRLACGRDGFHWSNIKQDIISIFEDLDIEIVAFYGWKPSTTKNASTNETLVKELFDESARSTLATANTASDPPAINLTVHANPGHCQHSSMLESTRPRNTTRDVVVAEGPSAPTTVAPNEQRPTTPGEVETDLVLANNDSPPMLILEHAAVNDGSSASPPRRRTDDTGLPLPDPVHPLEVPKSHPVEANDRHTVAKVSENGACLAMDENKSECTVVTSDSCKSHLSQHIIDLNSLPLRLKEFILTILDNGDQFTKDLLLNDQSIAKKNLIKSVNSVTTNTALSSPSFDYNDFTPASQPSQVKSPISSSQNSQKDASSSPAKLRPRASTVGNNISTKLPNKKKL